jgi:hypothetical protein
VRLLYGDVSRKGHQRASSFNLELFLSKLSYIPELVELKCFVAGWFEDRSKAWADSELVRYLSSGY